MSTSIFGHLRRLTLNRLFNPNPKGATSNRPAPVVLHLQDSPSSPIPRALLSPKTTLITIAPRWTVLNRYPIPLHDTTVAYSWITKHICASKPTYPSYSTPANRPIAVFATPPFSSVALSLSLTECRTTDFHQISALAVQDGIFDYSILAQNTCPSSADAKMTHFFNHYKSLFGNPAATFDPFVSPHYWFMSPGIHTPHLWPGQDEKTIEPRKITGADADYEEDPFMYDWDAVTSASNEPDPTLAAAASPPGIKRTEVSLGPLPKSSYLTFQSKGSALKLPHTLLAVSKSSSSRHVTSHQADLNAGNRVKKIKWKEGVWDDLIASQAVEMARVMRRSVSMHESKARVGIDTDSGIEEALDRIRLLELGAGKAGMEADSDGVWAKEFFEDVL